MANVVIWSCRHCNFTKETPDHIVACFHVCRSRRRVAWSRPRDPDEDRQAWAKTLLGAALTESVEAKYGDDTLLRGDDE